MTFEVCYITSRYVNSIAEGVNQASVGIIDCANRAGLKTEIISLEPVESSKVNPSVKSINTLFNDKFPRSLQRIAYNLNLQEIGSLSFLPFLPNYDIVHILPPLPTIFYSAMLRLIYRFKSNREGRTKVIPHLFHPFHPVMDEFMWGEGLSAQSFWRQKLWLLKHGAFDHIFCINQYLKKYAERFVDEGVVHYVPYPVDTDRFRPSEEKDGAREALGLPVDKFIVGYIGQVYSKRGVYTLLQAFDRVSKKLPEASLVMATRVLNPEKPHVQTFLNYLNKMESKEKVIVLSGVLEKVELFYQAVDVMVLPFAQPYYVIDPPLVVMETLASGIPLVTTPVGAIKEVTHDGLDAIHIPPDDDLTLSEEIMKLASDSDLRLRLGKNARNAAAKYSYDTVGARLKETYSLILE